MNRLRRLAFASIIAITVAVDFNPSSAQLVVFDPNNYAQNVLTAARAPVVGNLDTNRTQMSALVTSSQGATGALQAGQAGNQLRALVAQQLADLTALVAAHGRAQNLEFAQHAAAQDQSREQLRRFLTPGAGYQTTTVQMFH